MLRLTALLIILGSLAGFSLPAQASEMPKCAALAARSVQQAFPALRDTHRIDCASKSTRDDGASLSCEKGDQVKVCKITTSDDLQFTVVLDGDCESTLVTFQE
ncbi:hypothetical protein WDW37_16205 [Bdellovibrionota bacterium FG-1]